MLNKPLQTNKRLTIFKKVNKNNLQNKPSGPHEMGINLDVDLDINLELKKFIQEKDHPCLAAQSVMNSGALTMAAYPQLGTTKSVHAVAQDLKLFIERRKSIKAKLASFIAVFRNPVPLSAVAFEQLLWKQLRLLHKFDDTEWDPTVSKDPEDAHFSFSFAGTAFYVVGLHSNSERMARRFPFPALVFNQHAQFEVLRKKGQYEKMRDAIRERDIKLQGSLNPMLEDYGLSSEARQYSGRKVDNNWKCPFHKK